MAGKMEQWEWGLVGGWEGGKMNRREGRQMEFRGWGSTVSSREKTRGFVWHSMESMKTQTQIKGNL